MLKRLGLVLIISISMLMLVACGGNSDSKKASESKEVKMVSQEEITNLYSDPDKYKDYEVDLYVQIFAEVEKDDEGTYIQAWADPQNSEKNTIIKVNDPNLDVKNGDIIHIKGIVLGAFEGENAFGGQIVAAKIEASSVEKATYAEAFAPALKTIDVNQEQDHNGYVMKVTKIEIAEAETRVYLSINNNTEDKISFYDFNSKLVQGSKQYDVSDNFIADYEQMQSEILAGVVAEGMVVFPAVSQTENFNVVLEGSSDNWELQIDPFTFEVSVN